MSSATVTAAYLQGRINTLTAHLRSRMMNIFWLTKPPLHNTITSTATDQLRMDVETTALIRAAEEVLVLTRELKDLWLFGSLNTQREVGMEDEAQVRMEQDAKVVYDFLQETIGGDSVQVGGGMVNSISAD